MQAVIWGFSSTSWSFFWKLGCDDVIREWFNCWALKYQQKCHEHLQIILIRKEDCTPSLFSIFGLFFPFFFFFCWLECRCDDWTCSSYLGVWGNVINVVNIWQGIKTERISVPNIWSNTPALNLDLNDCYFACCNIAKQS